MFISKFTGNITEGVKLGRMIGYTHNYSIKTASPLAKSEEELASAPAPEPLPTSSSGTSTNRVTPMGSHSHHNHTLIRNKTHDGFNLSSPIKIHAQVKQAYIR